MLTLEAQKNHPPSIKLWNLLTACNDDEKSAFYFLGQCYYSMENFDYGFIYFLSLWKENDARGKTALLQHLQNWPDAMVTHFNQKLSSMLGANSDGRNIFSGWEIRKFEKVLLDALCESENITRSLKPKTLEALIARYWSSKNFQSLHTSKEQKKYLEQAILYGLLSAKQGYAPAQRTLIDIIDKEKAYDIYYSYLMPFLEAGDEEAQVLFNEVAYASPEAFNWFDNHFRDLHQKEKVTNIQDIAITKVLREYPQFLKNKRGSNSTIGAFSPNSLKTLDYQPNKISTPNFFAGEKSNVAIFDGLTDEEKELPPKDLYMLGMQFINKNNSKAICALLRAEEGGNKNAIKKLRDYRKSKIYKDGERTNKTDSIEYSLYIEDKNRGNLAISEKKESQTVPPSVQIVKSLPVSSQGKQRRQKNNQKEKSEKNSATVPVSTSSKKTRRLQKSEPFKSSESIINQRSIENKPTATIHLESLSTPVLETPQLKQAEIKETVIREKKKNRNSTNTKLESTFLVSNKDSSLGNKHKISQLSQENDKKINKTLSSKPKLERRNSETTIKSDRKPFSMPPLRRTESSRNLTTSSSENPTSSLSISIRGDSKHKDKDTKDKNNHSQKKLKRKSASIKKTENQTQENLSIGAGSKSTISSEKSRSRSSSISNESHETSSQESKKLRRVSSRNSLTLQSEENFTNEVQETLIKCGKLPGRLEEYFPRHNKLLVTILIQKFSLGKDEQNTLEAILLGSDDKATLQISDIKNLFVKFIGFTKSIKMGGGGHEKIAGMGITLNPNIDDKPGAYSAQINQLRTSIIENIVPTLTQADMP
ncbi:MAG: hypothetical protein ACOH2E_03125 [Candidatus Paracaedibacter sp.]